VKLAPFLPKEAGGKQKKQKKRGESVLVVMVVFSVSDCLMYCGFEEKKN